MWRETNKAAFEERAYPTTSQAAPGGLHVSPNSQSRRTALCLDKARARAEWLPPACGGEKGTYGFKLVY